MLAAGAESLLPSSDVVGAGAGCCTTGAGTSACAGAAAGVVNVGDAAAVAADTGVSGAESSGAALDTVRGVPVATETEGAGAVASGAGAVEAGPEAACDGSEAVGFDAPPSIV